MSAYDWSCFTKRININAATDKLYTAWATRAGIEGWFLRTSEYKKPDGTLRAADEPVQAGDTYKWYWHGWPDTTFEQGQILDANGKDTFKFTFGGPPDNPIIVTVTITSHNEENIVELTQENIPVDEHGKTFYHIGCMEGWVFHLTNMKSLFEGGIDLKNRDVDMMVFNK